MSPAFTVRAFLVLSTLLDTTTWPKWNNSAPRASLGLPSIKNGQSCPDVLFTKHVDMRRRGRNTDVKMRLLMITLEDMEEVEEVKEGSRVVWLGIQYLD